jgi:hypothetical protein
VQSCGSTSKLLFNEEHEVNECPKHKRRYSNGFRKQQQEKWQREKKQSQ